MLRTHPSLCTPSVGLCPSPAPSLLRTSRGPGLCPALPTAARASLARHVAATSGLRGSQRGPDTARASPPPRPPPRVFLFCFRSIAHLRAKCLLMCSSNRGVIPSRRGAPGTRAIHYSCPLRAGGLSTAATSGPLSHGPTKEMGVGVVDIPVLASAVGYHSTGDSGRNQFLLVSGAACPPFHTAPALLLPLP